MPELKTEEAPQTYSLDFLDKLIEAYLNAILTQVKKEPKTLKLGDLLKMIELRIKQTPDSEQRRHFWDMIENVRKEHLAESQPDAESDSSDDDTESRGNKG